MHPSRISSLLAGLGLLLPAAAVSQAPPADGVRWQCVAPVAQARDHHVVFSARSGRSDVIYVGGGTNYRELYDGLQRSVIGADGLPGPWTASTALPHPLAGASAVAARGYVVLTGGQLAGPGGLRDLKRVPETYTAPIAADGSIGAWTPGPALPAPRFHHPSVYHEGWVYVVGGQGATEAEAGVFGARLGADGSLGPWQQLRPLPEPRSHHAIVIDRGALYVIGGLAGNPARQPVQHKSVLRATIARDGTLGEWQQVSELPHSYATHSAFVHGGGLWVVGGVEDNATFSARVWRAPLSRSGVVGAWSEAQPLPVGRGHVHNTPVIGGRVYSVGGRIAAQQGQSPVTGAVMVGVLGPVAEPATQSTGCPPA
jgi:N-acetylneuraminic acid mutarotase